MKKIALATILCALFLTTQAQDQQVEKSIYGAQTGFLGIWGYNETRLSDEIALRVELGLDAGLLQSTGGNGADILWTPVITLEPRWYFNFNKRQEKGYRTDSNIGNFLSLKTSFNPDWFIINNTRNAFVPNQISIIPTWGIRRKVGGLFEYEAGIGVGYRRILDDSFLDQNEVAVNLHFRIGLGK